MKIVIDLRNTYNNDHALRRFTLGFWQDTVISQPGHDFIFITNQKETTHLPAGIPAKRLKKTHIPWLDRLRIKKILTACRADRLLTVQQAGFLIHNSLLRKNHTKELIPRDKQVLFAGAYIAGPVLQDNAFHDLTVLQPALPEVITSLTWAEAESIKTQYTGGRSFFLFVGDIGPRHNFIELLKAFSLFKKWQQSNMQLVIAGSATSYTATLEEKLAAYRYKQDVVLLKNIDRAEIAKLTAASYALVYPVADNVFPLAMLWALQAGKAIIATDNETNRQITSHAAWVSNTNMADGFSKAMIQLYKNENELRLLVQQASEQAVHFNRHQMLAAAWQCIQL